MRKISGIPFYSNDTFLNVSEALMVTDEKLNRSRFLQNKKICVFFGHAIFDIPVLYQCFASRKFHEISSNSRKT